MGAIFTPHRIGVIVICFGLLDIAGALITLGATAADLNVFRVYPSIWKMQIYSNNTYGGASARNDVDSDKSKYMYEFANVIEKFGRGQLWQRFQFDIIIICFGSFLVAYDSRRGQPTENLT